MNKKIYSKLRLFIVAVVAAVIAAAVINGNLLLAFMVMLLGILASYFIKKNVQEITEDERIAMVANKVSQDGPTFIRNVDHSAWSWTLNA